MVAASRTSAIFIPAVLDVPTAVSFCAIVVLPDVRVTAVTPALCKPKLPEASAVTTAPPTIVSAFRKVVMVYSKA
jgi:hypothetical protein